MGRISVRANRELCWRRAPMWADMDPRFLWKASGDEVQVFNWTGKNDYVALCEPESISFGGGCDTVLFFLPCFPLSPLTCQCWRLTCCFVTEMVITDSTWTKRSMKGHPLVARRSTMTLSVLQTKAQVKVAMVVMLAPPRLNALVWRSGALGYHHDMTFTTTRCMERAGVLRGHVSAGARMICIYMHTHTHARTHPLFGIYWML
jgi:hypothetical protein